MATLRLLAGGIAFLVTGPMLWAHPDHFAVTEIEWNPVSERFEVAMKLRLPDLEDALSLQQGARINIVSHPQSKTLIRTYLQQHVAVTFEGDDECVLHWVGMELDLHDVWIYFEAESKGRISNNRPANVNNEMSPSTRSDVSEWNDLFVARPPRPARSAERPVRRGTRPVRVRNTALMDIQPEQTNVVSLKVNSVSESAALSRREPAILCFTPGADSSAQPTGAARPSP
ncbi:MAG: hypothetical protein RIK87_05995 [Fuerstiella sp.]